VRLAFAAIALIVATPVCADVLVDNVDGLTLAADGSVQHFSGLLIDNNGRIQQLFLRYDKRPARADYRLDGKGRVLMPGLIDSHVELMKLGFTRIPPASPGARPRPEDRDRALVEAQKMLLERGITTVVDMGTTIEDWQSYRRAGDQGTLLTRVIAYAANTDAMSLIGGPGPTPWLYDDRLRLNGVQIVLDGPLETRAAALKAPYADALSLKVPLRLTEIQLKNLISRAAIDHFQIAVEANGDKAVAMLLDSVAELALTYKGERRWRIEQAQLIDPADLSRLNQNGVALAMQPSQLTSGLQAIEARLGPQRLAGAFGWKSVGGTGARLAFGSGAPNAAPDAFAGIAAAITRQGPDALPFGGWQAQERLTREAALAAYTTGAAWAAFGEGRIGRIAIGQRADFLLVDRDPMQASPSELRGIRVLQTWVGGKLVYQAQESPAAER
jgi:predicted amidohydrolase YtcJ